MTVTLPKPAAPDPLALATAALAEAARLRDGYPSELAHAVGALSRALESMLGLVGDVEAVTEYGVRSRSRVTCDHVVDPARDVHEALATLRATQRSYDPSAQLVTRRVLVASSAGAWTPIAAEAAR